jgi:hypothetical protein
MVTGADLRVATLAELVRANITVALVSGEGSPGWAASSAGRIIPGHQVLDATCGFTPLDSIRAGIEAGTIRFLGEIPAQYCGLTLDDPRFEPYLALAEEEDIPVLVHTGISFAGITYQDCCRHFRTSLGSPATVEEALARHPRLRLDLMHAGGPFREATLAIMYVYPNVYADLGVSTWFDKGDFRDLKTLIDAGLGDRLMFGTDQMVWPEAIPMAVDKLSHAPFLSVAQRKAIFCDNAARFLRMPAETCTTTKSR